MNQQETGIVMAFVTETHDSVTWIAKSVGDVFDIEKATNEAAEAVLSRYQNSHPGLFTHLMKTKAVNTCFCGECRGAMVIAYNKPLAIMVREVIGADHDEVFQQRPAWPV